MLQRSKGVDLKLRLTEKGMWMGTGMEMGMEMQMGMQSPHLH
jgi:hypothetical protein